MTIALWTGVGVCIPLILYQQKPQHQHRPNISHIPQREDVTMECVLMECVVLKVAIVDAV